MRAPSPIVPIAGCVALIACGRGGSGRVRARPGPRARPGWWSRGGEVNGLNVRRCRRSGGIALHCGAILSPHFGVLRFAAAIAAVLCRATLVAMSVIVRLRLAATTGGGTVIANAAS